MARDAELRARITAQDDASKIIDKVAEKADELEQPVEMTVEAKIAQAIGALEEVRDDARKAADAADALGIALGPELAAKADLSKVIAGFERVGLTLDEIKANADQLGASLRDVAGPDGAGLDQIGQRARAAGEDTDKLSDSARGANSALANMIGNSAQDVGALGGIAGSTGVAIGQMAEYAADASLGGERLGSALRSMATVAGPIALVAGLMQTLSGVMGENTARAEASAARIESMGTAMQSAGDDAVGLTDVLRASADELRNFATESATFGGRVDQLLSQIGRNIPLVGSLFGDAGHDIIDIADRAGISIYEMAQRVDGGLGSVDSLRVKLNEAAASGKLTTEEVEAFYGALDQMSIEADGAAQAQRLFNVTQEEANALFQQTLAQTAPLEQYTELWRTLMEDMADGSIDSKAAADAINELADKLGLTREEIIGLAQQDLARQLSDAADAAADATAEAEALAEGWAEVREAFNGVNEAFEGTGERANALGRAFESFNAGSALAFSEMAVTTVESFDSIKTALAEVEDIGSKPLVPTTVEELRGLSDESAAVVGSIGSMRDAIQTELSAALTTAGGDFDSLRDKAAFFRDEISTQFLGAFREMGLGPEEAQGKVDELLSALGLLPDQVETQIQLTQAEEAMRKIELFGSALTNLPPEVQAKVAAAIDASDPIKAWELINQGVQAQGAIPIDTTADPLGFTSGMAEIESGQYDATVAVDADTKPGDETLSSFTTERRETDPVKVDADTKAAIGTMLYLKILSALLQPIVTVTANTKPAMDGIASVAAQRPRVPIDVYLRDFPSASEIARAIGTVRVPVDGFVRYVPRIDGGREGG